MVCELGESRTSFPEAVIASFSDLNSLDVAKGIKVMGKSKQTI